jgi:hypothetical protein
MAIFLFFFTFVRSNAAIQKKGGNKKKKKKSREKRPSYVCYYDFAGGQTMMMASQTRCPELVMYLQKKNGKKWKKKEKVLRPREIIDLARWPFGTGLAVPLFCAQREGVCRYHNKLIESRPLLCVRHKILSQQSS